MSATWTYDGAGEDDDGVVSVALTGLTSGWQYKLYCWDFNSSRVIETAVSDTLTITMEDIGGPLDRPFAAWVGTDMGTGEFLPFNNNNDLGPGAVAATNFRIGTPGVMPEPAGVVVTYDGVQTLTFATIPDDTEYWMAADYPGIVQPWTSWQSVQEFGPTPFSLVLDEVPSGPFFFDLESQAQGWGDILSTVLTPGTAVTVHHTDSTGGGGDTGGSGSDSPYHFSTSVKLKQ